MKKTPQNIIYRSMKDALQVMVESQETAREKQRQDKISGGVVGDSMVVGPPPRYEKII